MSGDCESCGEPLGLYAVGHKDAFDGFRWYHNMCAPAITR